MSKDWRVLIVKTLTGEIVDDARLKDFPSFSRKLNDKGSFTVNFLIGQRANSAIDFYEYSQVGKYCWVVLHGDVPIQGGPAWSYQFTENTRTLSLSGTGLQGIFDKRILLNPDGHTAITDVSNDIAYSQEQLWEVLRRLVLYGTAETNYGLPFIVPSQYAQLPSGQGHKGNYYGYELAKVWDRMIDLTERIDGPEFDFVPEFADNQTKIKWRMNIGLPKLGNQLTLAVWDYGGALSQIDLDVNGSASPLARVWVKGEGSDRSLKTGFEEDQSLYALGFPPTDFVDVDHTAVKEQPTLEEYADKDLQLFRYPREKWTVKVRVDGRNPKNNQEVSPTLGTWNNGDAPTFGISGHPWIPEGNYRKRVIGFSDAGPEHVNLELEDDRSSTSA